MEDRRFTEIDLRGMLHRAAGLRPDVVGGRWVILEVTYRHGRPLAAYLYLPRRPGDKSYRATRVEPGLVIDFNRRGTPIGIEITAPGKLSVAALNRVLRRFDLPTVTRADLAPLRAA